MIGSDDVNDARLPLVVGIAADRTLTAEAARLAEEPVAKILADLRSLYRATPFLLMVQLPAPLRGSADRLAETFDADVVDLDDHPAFARSSWRRALDEPRRRRTDDTTCRAAFLADHSHLVIAISDSSETTPGNLTAQIIQFRLHGIPDRHTGRPLQLDNVGLGSVHHVNAEKKDGATANAPVSTRLCPQVETRSGDKELDDAVAWDHLDRFNADVARQRRRRSRAPACTSRAAVPSPWQSLPGHSWVGNRFAAAERAGGSLPASHARDDVWPAGTGLHCRRGFSIVGRSFPSGR